MCKAHQKSATIFLRKTASERGISTRPEMEIGEYHSGLDYSPAALLLDMRRASSQCRDDGASPAVSHWPCAMVRASLTYAARYERRWPPCHARMIRRHTSVHTVTVGDASPPSLSQTEPDQTTHDGGGDGGSGPSSCPDARFVRHDTDRPEFVHSTSSTSFLLHVVLPPPTSDNGGGKFVQIIGQISDSPPGA